MALLQDNPKDREYILMGLRIVGDFGATIAVPVIVFVLIGQKLDEKYGTSWKFTTIAFVLSALLSGKMIYNKAKEYGRKYEEIDKREGKK